MAVTGLKASPIAARRVVHNGGMSDQPQEPTAPTMEYIDAGPPGDPVRPYPYGPAALPKRRAWVPVVVGLVAFLVVLVGVGMVVGDWAERNVEMRALVSNIEQSESAMADVQNAIQAMSVHFDPNTPLTAEESAAVNEKLQQIAADGVVGISAGGALVESTTALPWHKDILAARDAYVAHNKAWQAYLTAAAKDASEFAKPQDNVNSTFKAAEQPIRDAVPRPALFSLPERVDAIFAPPPEVSGGPTQQA
jgi:hypothetical protein